jgi:uncharacterized coiled-coil DUF342 family protein
MDSRSSSQTATSSARRAEALAAKIPKQPERYALPVSFPQRPDMGPSTIRWVNDVKSLVEQANVAVSQAHDVCSSAAVSRKDLRQQAIDSACVTEDDARRRVDKLGSELRAVRKHQDALNAELVELLRARQGAKTKLQAVEKPLRDLHRRIEYRRREQPSTESSCDSATKDLIAGAENLSVAVHQLQLAAAHVERMAAHTDDLSRALRTDIEAREKLLMRDAHFVESATTQLSPVRHSTGGSNAHTPRLPVIVSPRATADNKHGLNSSANGSPQLADAASRNHPFTVTDPKRIAELATAAIHDSSLLRQELRKASKVVDLSVSENATLVESSMRQTIDDTVALQKILGDRMRLVEGELIEVERQRDECRAEIARLQGPLEDNTAKLTERRRAKEKSKTIPETGLKQDSLTEASTKETAKLRFALQAQRNQLHVLDVQRERLMGVLNELRAGYDSKSKLLAVDRRVLEIGHTPRPHSLASGRSASNRGTTASSRSQSPRQALPS